MDVSFLPAGPVTWSDIAAFGAFLFGVGKGVEWTVGKLRGSAREAVSPLAIDVQATKIDIRSLDEKLNAFKIEVARTYVTSDVIARLEGRIDAMVSSVREEMKETREAMMRAFEGRRGSG